MVSIGSGRVISVSVAVGIRPLCPIGWICVVDVVPLPETGILLVRYGGTPLGAMTAVREARKTITVSINVNNGLL